MRFLVLVLGCAACATTASVCPSGTKRIDVREQQGSAQWCTTADERLALVPEPGRDFTSVLGSHPRKMTGGVKGPFTSWYANGSVESHGHYLDFGSRSVPDGLWGFWYPNGQRRTVGMYHRGEPTGCFASWDEAGTRSTGFVEGSELRVSSCTPPADDELAIIEGSASEPAEPPVWADVSLQGFFGPGDIGARNAGQLDPDPSLRLAFQLAARLRLGRVRVGPIAGIRTSENTDYRGLAFGGVVAIALPVLHRRLDTEASIEVGGQYITATAIRPMQDGTAKLAFWSPLAAAQVTAAFELSPFLAAVASIRVDGTPARDVDRQVSYCIVGGCLPPQQETWTVGGFTYGLNLGLRLVLR
jgi:antitoxin component YwqK of YwqJK toxin-antitoxin module